MPNWLDLEIRFLEIEVQLRNARLDYQGGAAGEYWRIAATCDRLAKSRFEAISKLAGRKLILDDGAKNILALDLQNEPDDAMRWYRAMKLYSGHYEHGVIGFQTNDDGKLCWFNHYRSHPQPSCGLRNTLLGTLNYDK